MILFNGNNPAAGQLLSSKETTLPGLPLFKRSLHKNIYDFGETLLIVANNQTLNRETYEIENVPGKGQVVSKQLREHCSSFLSETLRELALRRYFRAWKLARNRDVLLVSTVFRFGLHENQIHLIGECITPDSSRFSCEKRCRAVPLRSGYVV